MFANEVFASLNGFWLDVKDPAVAIEQRASPKTSNPVSDVVSGGCRSDSDQDDPADVEVDVAGGERASISRIVSPGRGTPTLSMSKPTRTTQ